MSVYGFARATRFTSFGSLNFRARERGRGSGEERAERSKSTIKSMSRNRKEAERIGIEPISPLAQRRRF
jgi:hypothetical protein